MLPKPWNGCPGKTRDNPGYFSRIDGFYVVSAIGYKPASLDMAEAFPDAMPGRHARLNYATYVERRGGAIARVMVDDEYVYVVACDGRVADASPFPAGREMPEGTPRHRVCIIDALSRGRDEAERLMSDIAHSCDFMADERMAARSKYNASIARLPFFVSQYGPLLEPKGQPAVKPAGHQQAAWQDEIPEAWQENSP